MPYLISFIVSLIPIFAVFALRWWLGRDYLQPMWLFPVLVLFGGLGGVVFGLAGSPLLQHWFEGLAADQGDTLVWSVLVVPLAEEIGKALILLILFLTIWYRSAADGLTFGFAAGAGYAAIENLVFLTVAQASFGSDYWTMVLVTRLVPSTLLHGGTTALVGAYLGAARWDRRPLVVLASLPSALLVATLIHGAWNGLIEIATNEHGSFHALLAVGLLVGLGLVLIVLLAVSHRIESATIRRELEAVVRDGLLTPIDLEAVVDRHARRTRKDRWHRSGLARAAIGLAYTLRGRRRGSRDERHVRRFRRDVARAHPDAGRLSAPTPND
jgi:RsiW-degrading membrane proteinase PrsW (M82 family)